MPKERPEVPICERCGQQHINPQLGVPSCPGHISSGEKKGEPCRNPLGKGTDHVGKGACRFHAGLTPSANKKAARETLQEEAQKLLGLTEWDPVLDPFSELADFAGRQRAVETILLSKIEELASLKEYGGPMGDKISVTFEAWERAHSRFGTTLLGMARLDLDDRIARIQSRVDDATATKIREALSTAVRQAGITAEQQDALMIAFGQALRDKNDAPASPVAVSRSAGVPVANAES